MIGQSLGTRFSIDSTKPVSVSGKENTDCGCDYCDSYCVVVSIFFGLETELFYKLFIRDRTNAGCQ